MGKKRKPDEIPSSSPSEELTPIKQEESSLIPPIEHSLPPPIKQEDQEQEQQEQEQESQQQEQQQQEEEPINDPDEQSDEENSPSTLQKLLEPFSKDQVIDLLQNAALKHPDILSSIKQTANRDPAHRKVFVHGLGWNATAQTLIDSFHQYGDIEDCNAIVDKLTGRCKGYGFILFRTRSGAHNALKDPQKKIGSKMTSCQLASEGPPPGPANSPSLSSEYTQRKIYVSNVGADLDPKKVLQFFARFGEIEEGPLGLDRASGKLKGFCLFVYKSGESARKALEEPHKNFEGHVLHCQRAIDGPKIGGKFYGRGMQLGKSGIVGAQGVVQFGGGLVSSVAGPGHLIAPPAVGMRFSQAGQGNSNAGVGGYNPGLGKDFSACRGCCRITFA